jgi:putative ABC transport system permease protein
MISHLDRKLLRDLRHLAGQGLAVALVMACGLAMMIMMRSLIGSIEDTRDAYYRQTHFADVFAALTRAPLALGPRIAALPGVATVQTGIARYVTLDVPDLPEPAVGLINSLPDFGEPILNRLHLRAGRFPVTVGRREVVVSEPFAEAHGLRPGDAVAAILNGRKLDLRIVGIVLSPEFVFESRPGAALPDNRTFGVFWMGYTELATAFNLDGAFNQVALALAPGASADAVVAELDRLLEPYGGRGAYDRELHPSHARLRDEIEQMRVLAVAYPIVFLGVAAFMTNAVLSRQIALQREQIAILKAFGYSNAQVGWHFLKFALAIVAVGTALGALGGVLLGRDLVDLYHQFFRFPRLEFRLAFGAMFAAGLVSAAAATLGVAGAVRRAVRLPPAEAMRPEPPATYRRAILERLGIDRWFTQSLRMALRNLERKPFHSMLTCGALALATGIMVIPNAFRDGIAYVLDFQWDLLQRQHATVSLVEPGPPRVLHDLRNLPGVTAAEPYRSAPVELRAGHRTRRLALTGLHDGSELNRVIDRHHRQLRLVGDGVVLSAKLGEVLGLRVGDTVHVRALDGARAEHTVRVAAFAEDYAGTSAYMELDALNRLLGDGDRTSGAHLRVDDAQWTQFLARVKETPRVAGVAIKETLRGSFRETTARSMGLIQTIYLIFATTVAFGIVYNSARISLSERSRELATLRVIGFTRGEVAAVLVAEIVLLTLVALPCGLMLGVFGTEALLRTVDNEFIRLPFVLTPSNLAFAVLVIVIATSLSALWAARKLNQLDLVSALKAQE